MVTLRRWISCALALAPLSASGANALQIEAVSPNQLAYGHAHTVQVTLNNAGENTQLALAPGGPFVTATIDYANALYLHVLAATSQLLAVTPESAILVDTHAAPPATVAPLRLPFTATRAAASNTFLAVAGNDTRLQVSDLRRGGLPHASTLLTIPARIVDVSVSGDNVFVLAKGGRLYRVDAAAEQPRPVDFGRLDPAATVLRVANTTCYAAGADIGLVVADCTGTAARERARFVTSGVIHDLQIDGELAFIADGSAGLTLVDVSAPDRPVLRGSNNKLGDVRRVAVDAERVLVANARGELILVDVLRPRLPLAAARIRLGDPVRALAWRDGNAWAATAKSVQRIDFNSDAAPLLSDEGVNLGGSRRGFIHDKVLYVADWFSGLHIYDVSTPRRLRHLGNFHTPGSSKGVVVRDGYAYVGDDDHGLQIVDVRDPAKPEVVGSVLTPGLAYTMKLIGTLLYLADHRGGLHIIDVGDVRHPRIVGSFDTPGKAWAVDVRDGVAFVADDQSGLLILDVHDPARIELIGQFAPGGLAEDVRLRDQLAFVTFFDGGLYVLDISDPRHPRPVSHTPIPGNARGVELQGDYAYIAAWEAGLQVVDIRDATQPRIVGYYDTDGSVWGVSVDGDVAYALDWWGGVKAIDIRTPARPQLLDRYHARAPLRDLVLTGRFAFAAAGASGVQIFDIRNPLNPIWVTGVELPGEAVAIAVDEDSAYVAHATGVARVSLYDPFGARLLPSLPQKDMVQVRAANGRILGRDITGKVYQCIHCREQLRYPMQHPHWDLLATEVDDFWLDGDLLYLARGRHGVSLQNLRAKKSGADMTHRIAATRPALLVRAQDALVIAVVNDELTVYERHTLSLAPRATLSAGAAIRDAQLIADTLYLTTDHDELLIYDLAERTQPKLRARYGTTQTITRLAVRDGQAFFAGEPRLMSLRFLPGTTFTRVDARTFTVTIPAGLPLGSYNVIASDDSTTVSTLHNALNVSIKTGRKPGLTPEQFQQLLQQQRKASGPAH